MPLSDDAIAIIQAVRETTGGLETKLAAMKARQDELFEGFPGGDPEAHRRYHESIIEWRELRNRMVKEALVHAAKVGGIGAFGWILYALWTAFKMELTK
ncbi:MAG: hypothetical protein EPN31_07530 [Castellaniella sp.]|uniref:hypothetical protein n=1 Tax=Castellaniella sp. TaxID=1955812 RepID=UPI001228CD73|nr:hypothetical protein [Castellaniella sp.]TAN28853.1 MAG: hypothetical protein EPN31_07530 [Castellaniella sp.]